MTTIPNPASSATPPLETAHVLFMDIVAYSKLPMDQQQKLLTTLQEIVRNTQDVALAQKDRLLRLPTGDGMALVFFGNFPESPVRCAVELGQKLRQYPEIKLRMGIHAGPVYRVNDINDALNVQGGGINMAQRVMDCGDAGHILVSSSVADVLTQVSKWSEVFQDLGEVEIKHGDRVHLYNLYSDEVGNPELPLRVKEQREQAAAEKECPVREWLGNSRMKEMLLPKHLRGSLLGWVVLAITYLLIPYTIYFLGTHLSFETSYNKGSDFYFGRGEPQDYTRAVRWWRKAAEAGDPAGMASLGFMYQNGYGVVKDYQQAVFWYRKAGDKGNAYGMSHLGFMYQNGYGVDKDYKQAFYWFGKGAEGGDAEGMFYLGVAYENGYGTEKDRQQAISWYRQGAQLGNQDGKDALKRLGESAE